MLFNGRTRIIWATGSNQIIHAVKYIKKHTLKFETYEDLNSNHGRIDLSFKSLKTQTKMTIIKIRCRSKYLWEKMFSKRLKWNNVKLPFYFIRYQSWINNNPNDSVPSLRGRISWTVRLHIFSDSLVHSNKFCVGLYNMMTSLSAFVKAGSEKSIYYSRHVRHYLF